MVSFLARNCSVTCLLLTRCRYAQLNNEVPWDGSQLTQVMDDLKASVRLSLFINTSFDIDFGFDYYQGAIFQPGRLLFSLFCKTETQSANFFSKAVMPTGG